MEQQFVDRAVHELRAKGSLLMRGLCSRAGSGHGNDLQMQLVRAQQAANRKVERPADVVRRRVDVFRVERNGRGEFVSLREAAPATQPLPVPFADKGKGKGVAGGDYVEVMRAALALKHAQERFDLEEQVRTYGAVPAPAFPSTSMLHAHAPFNLDAFPQLSPEDAAMLSALTAVRLDAVHGRVPPEPPASSLKESWKDSVAKDSWNESWTEMAKDSWKESWTEHGAPAVAQAAWLASQASTRASTQGSTWDASSSAAGDKGSSGQSGSEHADKDESQEDPQDEPAGRQKASGRSAARQHAQLPRPPLPLAEPDACGSLLAGTRHPPMIVLEYRHTNKDFQDFVLAALGAAVKSFATVPAARGPLLIVDPSHFDAVWTQVLAAKLQPRHVVVEQTKLKEVQEAIAVRDCPADRGRKVNLKCIFPLGS